ncbi:MAG: NrfD/PsrC family molybdoenzyme membrane anchor subunit, partial [Pseudomonadota bacterium]
AFFFSEIGAGLYLVSLFFEFWRGCLVGWLLSAILGGGLHLLYLGRPERAWRAILRPAKSELSRGLIIMGLFLGLGAIQIAPSLGPLRVLPWEGDMLFLKIAMITLSFFMITHGFMTMNVMSAVAFWNSAILPVLSLASGLWLGSQLGMVAGAAFSEGGIFIAMEPLARWSLFAYAFLIIVYLWNSAHSSSTVKESLRVIVKGDLARFFYIGVVLIGLIVPLAVSLKYWVNGVDSSQGFVYLRFLCAFIGDLALRYVITKSGRYTPLIYTNLVRG